jgi:hypothetical protein
MEFHPTVAGRAVMRLVPAVVVVAACTHAAPIRPSYVTVHVDTLTPDRFAEFEDARREWVGVLRAAGATDQRGTFFEVAGIGFVTMRPFARFGELDPRGAERTRALAHVSADALERYTDRSDAALAFPHRSEIWQRDDDLGYAPAHGALDERTAGAIELVIEDVKADAASEREYDAVWTAMRDALARASFPLTRVTYGSVYGSGRVVTLWLASSAGVLASASLERALRDALGEQQAAALLARRDAVVLRVERHAARRRDDLSSP